MSRLAAPSLDPASQTAEEPIAAAAGRASRYEWTTQGLPAAERLDHWRTQVLHRMEPHRVLDPSVPFQARLRRIGAGGLELVEHESDALRLERTAGRCQSDGRDEIGLMVIVDRGRAELEQGRPFLLRHGAFAVLDFARPISLLLTRHRLVGLVIPRRRLREAADGGLAALSGGALPLTTFGTILRSHMRSTLQQTPRLAPAERAGAIEAAADMALALLQTHRRGTVQAEEVAGGFYAAAVHVIADRCADPDLRPALIAAQLGCSRASLYRIFAEHDQSVSAVIWVARLERARRLLASPQSVGLLVSEIAFQSGFLDHTTFDRMFKRRYGMTPRDARDGARPFIPPAAVPMDGLR